MQWLASICVKRPVFTWVLILSVTVVGAVSFLLLSVDRFPKVDLPTIMVTTRLPGAAPAQVETEVSDKVEEALNTISLIDELRSVSSEGVSQVVVSFLMDKDIDVAAQEARDKLNQVIPQLPRTIEQPTVETMDPDAAPVLTVSLTADRPVRDLTEYADKVLRRQIESVGGVGQVVVVGGRARQVNIWLDADRLRAYNLTVSDVSRALMAQNVEVPAGRIEEGPQTVTLRTLGRVQSVPELGRIVVRARDGHLVTIADVARVEDGMEEAASIARTNGQPSVLLQIRRQSGTNTVEIVHSVKERLNDLAGTLPPGYALRVVRDQSEFIEASIRSVEEHLILGSVLAALVVLLFLGNLRSTVIAAIAIPTSIIATFGLIWYMGFTLNMLTMLALTLSVGIVIDDAIVVLENIYRFIEEKGMSPMEAAIEGTREIGLAVLATTLSLVAIFVPVGFMGGIVGRFMKSFGLTMAFAIMVSLFVSFTLTPMLSSRWLTREAEPGHGRGKRSKDSRLFRFLDTRYTRLLHLALAHRGIVAGLALLVLVACVPLFIAVDKNFMPNDDQSEFEVSVRAAEGTSLESMDVIISRVARTIRERVPEVDYTLATVGDDVGRTPNSGSVYVRLTPMDRRARSQFAVMDEVRDQLLPEIAGDSLRTGVRQVAAIGGSGNQAADIQLVVSGPDLDRLEEYAARITEATRKIPGAVDVDTSMNPGKPELTVALDRLKAADLGVEIADAAEALRLLVGGAEVTTYNESGEQYAVRLRAEAANRTTAQAVAQLSVPSSRIGSVSLDNLATFTAADSPSEINRLGRQRVVTIFAGMAQGQSQQDIMTAMTDAASALGMDPGYQTRFQGRSRELGRAAQGFILAFVLSLVFMYLILAAQFESWLHPVTILLSLPLTLPFALLSIIVTGQSLNIFSALGLLVLFGVVKKNSILQIDHAIRLHESGMERHDAIVQSSRDRLRPILMTTLAFVAGMIPLVVSSGVGSGTDRALGFVIIGGQSLVLIVTLVVTPVAYSLFDDAAQLKIWSRIRRRVLTPATTALVLLAALLRPAPAEAQVRLTEDDVIRLAIENNPDLTVARLDLGISDTRVAQASGAFGPTVATSFQRNNQLSPPSSFLVGSSGTRTDTFTSSLGVGQRLKWGGGSYSVAWDSSRSTSDSFLLNFNPTLRSGLSLSFSQPLLRDLAMDASRQQLATSRRGRAIADARFEETTVRKVAEARHAFWNLVLARAALDVQRQSFDLARELARVNAARVEVGSAPPLDLVSAEVEVAQREEALIVAETAARQAEDALRVLILDPNRPDFWTVGLETADLAPVEAPPADVETAARTAREERRDLVRVRHEIDNAATNVRYFGSQRLPDVRLQATLFSDGLGGTQLTRVGGFPGTLVGAGSETSFGNVLNQVLGADFPTWTLGVTISYPLGQSAQDAAYARAQIEERQARARLRSLEVNVVHQIRDAAAQVAMNARRLETVRRARELAEERLDAEQRRFEVGISTSFLVIQAQRDLAQARNNQLTTELAYHRALIDFEALQRASPAGGATQPVDQGDAAAVPAAAAVVPTADAAARNQFGGVPR